MVYLVSALRAGPRPSREGPSRNTPFMWHPLLMSIYLSWDQFCLANQSDQFPLADQFALANQVLSGHRECPSHPAPPTQSEQNTIHGVEQLVTTWLISKLAVVIADLRLDSEACSGGGHCFS